MAQGTVKWFNDDKGYGFITPDEGGEDVFVHHTGIAGNGYKNLEEGSKVSYEATQGRKGLQADNVSKVKPAGLSTDSRIRWPEGRDSTGFRLFVVDRNIC